MKKAFTIVELLLAIGLLAALLVTSGAVFRMAAKAHITAAATAEISRKLRGITDQLNADFRGLRKDGEIFIAWVPRPVDDDGDGQVDRYERFDRIMFFADGDFQSYSEQAATGNTVRGDVARVGYMLAKNGYGQKAQVQDAEKRTLARSQHSFTGESTLVDSDPTDPTLRRDRWIDLANIRGQTVAPPVPGQFDWTGAFTEANNNSYEYDNLTLKEWLNIPWVDKQEILTIVTDILVGSPVAGGGGLIVDTETPLNVHELMADGVGEFKIQSWYALQGRWFPEVDPDGNGDLADTDFNMNGGVLDEVKVPGLLYPYVPHLAMNPADMHGYVVSPSVNYPRVQMDEEHFDSIPGLGRALKFTFTLYDSRGVFKDGKKFTHIVYLDD